jgi:hypothetical protein
MIIMIPIHSVCSHASCTSADQSSNEAAAAFKLTMHSIRYNAQCSVRRSFFALGSLLLVHMLHELIRHHDSYTLAVCCELSHYALSEGVNCNSYVCIELLAPGDMSSIHI